MLTLQENFTVDLGLLWLRLDYKEMLDKNKWWTASRIQTPGYKVFTRKVSISCELFGLMEAVSSTRLSKMFLNSEGHLKYH